MTVEQIADELIEKGKSDGSIDYIFFHEATSIIGRITQTITGFLILFILVLVPIVTSLEVIYICFPIIRDKTEQFLCKIEGNGIAKNAIGATLRDAREAVKQANTVETGKSAMAIYFKLKITSLMFAMYLVCLVIGGSSTIVAFVWKIIQPVVAAIFKNFIAKQNT